MSRMLLPAELLILFHLYIMDGVSVGLTPPELQSGASTELAYRPYRTVLNRIFIVFYSKILFCDHSRCLICYDPIKLAERLGLEPRTSRLTAGRSAD